MVHSFVYREGNCVAHTLAQFSLNLYEEKVWIEDCPNVIFLTVTKEQANI